MQAEFYTILDQFYTRGINCMIVCLYLENIKLILPNTIYIILMKYRQYLRSILDRFYKMMYYQYCSNILFGNMVITALADKYAILTKSYYEIRNIKSLLLVIEMLLSENYFCIKLKILKMRMPMWT